MINLKSIRELYIANAPVNFLDESNLRTLDYKKWKEYVSDSDFFVWFEDTKDGKSILKKIDTIPDDFKDSILALFNQTSCYADFNLKKNNYNIGIIFYDELRRIVISFERKVTINDLKIFLDMANYLDAYLLNNGTEIIDEKVIESLE
jgi:hypothetical protein